MTDTELAYLRTVYDAVLWLAEELRLRDPNLPLPHYVSEIVFAATKPACESLRALNGIPLSADGERLTALLGVPQQCLEPRCRPRTASRNS
jgi:hypothetical protein